MTGSFLLHYFNHAGFLALENIEADTVEDAAYKQMLSRHTFLTKEATPHTYKVKRRDKWIVVVVYADAFHQCALGHYLNKGDYWFTSKHMPGEEDDCLKCGGTGGDHYRLFMTQCWACGTTGERGKGTGKRTMP